MRGMSRLPSMKVLSLMFCLALGACASPRWVNPQNPAADLQAALTLCEKDAAQVVRQEQLIGQVKSACSGAHCAGEEEQHRLKAIASAVAAQKRCMAARGWREG